MAIIVSEEKNRSASLVRLAGWFAVLATVGAAIYYIFFVTPDVVVIPPGGNLQSIAPIATITIHPEDVINSAAFQSLQTNIPPPSPSGPVSVGRSNPFANP